MDVSLRARIKRVAAVSCSAALALSACTTPVLVPEEDLPPTPVYNPAAVIKEYKDYDTLVVRADLEIQRAADKGFLWLNTESYLAEARAAHKAGDMEKAMKLAQTALEEALLAQKQAEDSARAKPNFTYRR